MPVDRIFADQDELDTAQSNGEFANGELYLVLDGLRLLTGDNTAETKPIFGRGENADFAAVAAENEIATNDKFVVDGLKVVGNRESAVADASGGSVVDTQARVAINALLARLRTHGLIAT